MNDNVKTTPNGDFVVERNAPLPKHILLAASERVAAHHELAARTVAGCKTLGSSLACTKCSDLGMANCHCPGENDVFDLATITHSQVANLKVGDTLRYTGSATGKTPAGIGDVNSDAKGSGARFNTGKPDLSLIPLTMMSGFFHDYTTPSETKAKAVAALECLGLYQSVKDTAFLFTALEKLGTDGWEECAHVFSYGKRKYAAWNWAKGMPWSVPLACAARHLLALIAGEDTDNESGLPHRGHVFCNIVMLLQYSTTYTEGDDLPPKGLL